MMVPRRLSYAMELAGLLLMAAGLWSIYWPLALIVTGGLLVFLSKGVTNEEA